MFKLPQLNPLYMEERRLYSELLPISGRRSKYKARSEVTLHHLRFIEFCPKIHIKSFWKYLVLNEDILFLKVLILLLVFFFYTHWHLDLDSPNQHKIKVKMN